MKKGKQQNFWCSSRVRKTQNNKAQKGLACKGYKDNGTKQTKFFTWKITRCI